MNCRSWLFILVFSCGGVSGQPLASTPQPLTIDAAVREALDHNLSLLAERYNLSVADARIVQARLRPNPVLSAGVDYQDLLGRGFTAINSAGPPEINVRTDFLLEGGHKRERRIETAEAVRTVAQLNLLNSMRQIAFDVQSAFVDMLLAKESLALAQENLGALRGIVAVNGERVRTGDLAAVELSRSQVAELQLENAVRQSALRLRTASNRLQTLLGRPTLFDGFDVAGTLRRDTPPVVLEEVRAQAMKLRPDLEALRRDQARSQSEVRLQLAQGKIDYTLGAMYHHQYGYSNGRAFGFFLSMPLPVFNRNQGEIERARMEQRQIEARIRALESAVATEVHNAYQQYDTARSLLENIERSMLEKARDVRSTTEYSYRHGEASLVEFLDAQRAFNDTMQGYNEARAEYARSLFLLDSISGKAVNP